jgi:hypothetical protein
MPANQRLLKEAIMTAIENAIESGMTPEDVEETILSLISGNGGRPFAQDMADTKTSVPVPEHCSRPPQTTTCGQCNTDCTIPTPQGWICECGQTQIFSKEYLVRNLSPQAKKLLLGHFPVRGWNTAVQELESAGLVFQNSLMWFQTEAGLKERFRLEYPDYAAKNF